MPPGKFILLLTCVIGAAALTVWAVSMTPYAGEMSPESWLIVVPAVLLAYVLWRAAAKRGNPDDHDPK